MSWRQGSTLAAGVRGCRIYANVKQSSLMTYSQLQGGGVLIVVVQPQF